MNEVEEIRRGAYEQLWTQRDTDGRFPGGAVERFISAWRSAPAVAYAVQLGEAADAQPVLERLVTERTRELEIEVRLARREAVLLNAALAVSEVSA